MEILVENFDEVMNGLQICQTVVVNVYADTEVESGVASVDDFEVSEFDEVRVFGVTDSDQSMHFFD